MAKTVLQLGVFLLLVLNSFSSFAQAPAQFNFQGVARNAKGAVIVAKPIALRFSIRADSASGFFVYQEQRSVITDSNGVFNAVIGGGNATSTTGNLSTVPWTNGAKFLQIEMDTANGSTFIDLGATQLLSVPYALFSNNSFNSGYATSSGAYFFEAYFPTATVLPPAPEGSRMAIPFPRTIYNTLDRVTLNPVYDSTTGIFTAPEAGIYQFDFFANGTTNDQIGEGSLYLAKNGEIVRRIIENESYNNETRDTEYIYEIHTRLLLERGDKISITFKVDYDRYEAENEDHEVNSGSYFSGYKIY